MLTLMYIGFAVVGTGYLLVSVLLGQLDFGDGDGDGDGGDGHGEGESESSSYGLDGSGHGTATADAGGGAAFHFPLFSPRALATLLASIGGFGLIGLHGFHLEGHGSLLLALPAALVTTYAITYVSWRVMRGSQGTSMIRLHELSGALAEVTTPIPAGGLGEVAAMVSGQRYSSSAREEDGKEVPRGTLVTVVNMVGSTLVVRIREKPEGGSNA